MTFSVYGANCWTSSDESSVATIATTLSNGIAAMQVAPVEREVVATVPLDLQHRRAFLPERMPTSLTFQFWTVSGLICVGDLNGARLEPSLIVVPPTVMSSTSRPPSLTPPSLT